jgi:hypothetical protein
MKSLSLINIDCLGTLIGPVHMGKSYIPVSEKTFRLAIYFCSVHMEKRYPPYRPGKVSGCDVALNMNWIEKLLTRQKVYPAKRESCVHITYGENIIPVTENSPVKKRDLGTQENFLSHTKRSVTFHIIFIPRRVSLVNLSKPFLANQDNFCPYEQALIM